MNSICLNSGWPKHTLGQHQQCRECRAFRKGWKNGQEEATKACLMPDEFAMAALIEAFRQEHRTVLRLGTISRNDQGGWDIVGWHTEGGDAGINMALWERYFAEYERRWNALFCKK